MPRKAAEKGSPKKKVGKKGSKKKKDPDAPKRNKSAYMFFCSDKREQVKNEHPDMKMTDISKELAKMWKVVTDGDKKPFAKKAEEDKKRYEKEKKEYTGKKKHFSDCCEYFHFML